jgi:hypothetical protein
MKLPSAYYVTASIHHVVFTAFVAIKLAGTTLAAWSWWWLLMPLVPLLGAIVQRVGL